MTRALAPTARVLNALVLREIASAFSTARLGYLWAIVTPVVGTCLLTALFSAIGRAAPFGASLALFLATGLVTVEFFNRTAALLTVALQANQPLMSYPQVRALDILLARAILVWCTYAIVIIAIFSGLCALGLAGPPAHPAVVLAALATTGAMGFGYGALNAGIAALWDGWLRIERIVTRPVFILSGIFYVPGLMPPQIRDLLIWNPVLHLVEWMRAGWYVDYAPGIARPDFAVAVALGLVLAALVVERFGRKGRAGR